MRTSAPLIPSGIERLDPRLDAIVAADSAWREIGRGFAWSEGPVWRRSGGYLLFSDIPNNAIHCWRPGGGLSLFMRPAGFTEEHPFGRELGTNGLTFDLEDRLVMCDHGNRRVVRLNERNFTKVVLAQQYGGRRLNSPNDLVFRRDGTLYFTDPSFGLDGIDGDPAREQPCNGVYRLSPDGVLRRILEDLSIPNGLAFSPDEKLLYVANCDAAAPHWMAYPVEHDGSLGSGRVFFDASALVNAGRPGLPDGLKVDEHGNLFCAGPGGVLVLTPCGEHLGTLVTGEKTSNCAFGEDGRTLFVTADSRVLALRLKVRGAEFT